MTKIKDTGKGAPRIVVTDRSKPKIDPYEIAERLGADIVIEAPNFGGGPAGMMAGATWFSARRRSIMEAEKKMGFRSGDHVRIWLKTAKMSFAGRVRGFDSDIAAIIDGVDGKTRCVSLDDIEKSENFGSLLPKEQRPKFGRPMRQRKPYLDQSHRRHK